MGGAATPKFVPIPQLGGFRSKLSQSILVPFTRIEGLKSKLNATTSWVNEFKMASEFPVESANEALSQISHEEKISVGLR